MKFGLPVKQSQPFNRDFSGQLMLDLLFYGILNFSKKDVVALTFVKFELSS